MVLIIEPEVSECEHARARPGVVVSHVRIEEFPFLGRIVEEVLSILEVLRRKTVFLVQFPLQEVPLERSVLVAPGVPEEWILARVVEFIYVVNFTGLLEGVLNLVHL